LAQSDLDSAIAKVTREWQAANELQVQADKI